MVGKYGTAGWRQIKQAVTALATADRARGLSSRLVLLDAPPTGIPPVPAASDAAATKAAVDAVATAMTPLYLLLLGAPDVVVQSVLVNPTRDDDPTVPT